MVKETKVKGLNVLAKRKNLTKKTRFEVFKRDSFKCQYCGQSAPDVVLEVDHIKPVAEGGDNDLLNLITSCFDCNRGKKHRLLDDSSVLEKSRKQLEELNERRNQLEMMMKWREGLKEIDDSKEKIIKDKWCELTGYNYNENGLKSVKQWLKKYDLNLILDCMETSCNQYLKYEEKEEGYTSESVEKTFNYIGKIAAIKNKGNEEPYMKEIYYIHGILRNRLNYYDQRKAIAWLKESYLKGASLESLKEVALNVKHWTEFRITMEEFFNRFLDD